MAEPAGSTKKLMNRVVELSSNSRLTQPFQDCRFAAFATCSRSPAAYARTGVVRVGAFLGSLRDLELVPVNGILSSRRPSLIRALRRCARGGYPADSMRGLRRPLGSQQKGVMKATCLLRIGKSPAYAGWYSGFIGVSEPLAGALPSVRSPAPSRCSTPACCIWAFFWSG